MEAETEQLVTEHIRLVCEPRRHNHAKTPSAILACGLAYLAEPEAEA